MNARLPRASCAVREVVKSMHSQRNGCVHSFCLDFFFSNNFDFYPIFFIHVVRLRYPTLASRLRRGCVNDHPHTFRKVGAFPAMHELQTKSRVRLVRVVLEVDLVQRPRPIRLDLRAFGRRALTDLLKQVDGGLQLPALHLFGVTQRGDMLSGFVDLPDTIASRLLSLSGKVRGVFARPFINGGADHALPSGFRVDSHRIVWAKVARFSDVVFGTLQAAQVSFAGLVCPRSRGEVGVRLFARPRCHLPTSSGCTCWLPVSTRICVYCHRGLYGPRVFRW